MPNTTTQSELAPATLRINQEGWTQAWRRIGCLSAAAKAERLGNVHYTTIRRVEEGKLEPGPRFIAAVVKLFGKQSFSRLFEVVDDNEAAA